jgi:uncharacterized RDD family membrane protein YckC
MDAVALPAESDLAGFWWRVLGFVIDTLIVAAVTALPARLTSLNFYVASLATVIVVYFYWAFFIAYWDGQTLGMKVVRIRCVNIDGRGPVDLRQSSRRSAAYSVLLLIGSLYHYRAFAHPTPHQSKQMAAHAAVLFTLLIPHYLDLLWVAWDQKNQTLHDKFAKTIVIRPKEMTR